MNSKEQTIVDNFIGTLDTKSTTLQEAIFNGEDDAKAYGLSVIARRTLGARIRAAYARGGK